MSQFNDQIPADKELIKAIVESDSAAYKILFQRFYKPLIRFAWYRIYSMETAGDLVQELFIKVWINRHRLDPDKSIKAYLYKSLTNSIINHTKLHSSRTISLDNIDNDKNTGTFSNPDLNMDIQNAINQLPIKLKTVYIYSEIAEICNISVKAVEKRMSGAFKILRIKLRK